MNNRKVNRSRRMLWVVGAVILVLVALPMAMRSRSEQPNYEHYVVSTDSIVRTVSGVGRVTPLHKETMLASSGTQISRVFYGVGEEVKKGDVLVRTASGAEIKAPFAGEVSAVYVKENEWINPGGRLVEVTDYKNLEISAQVDELDVAKIAVGQEARIDINALTDEILVGPITAISREGVFSGGITTFAVKVAIADSSNLRLGMSAEIKVEIARADNVLVVPIEAVLYEENTPYVLVLRDNKSYERQNISVGMSNGEVVEVSSGLSAGATVAYVNPVSAQQSFGPGFGGPR